MNESEQVEAVKAELSGLVGRGRGSRYPAAIHVRVAECVRMLERSGMSRAAAARLLGLPVQTVQRWVDANEVELRPSFVPVIAEMAQPAFTVLGPCGLRIEGLDLESLARLLRSLA